MNIIDIAHIRLRSQLISDSGFEHPEDVVAWMGALQAQDYNGAKWSIALRLPSPKHSEIEQSILNKRIVRSWPMRGTLHFVSAKDFRWMLALLAPGIIASGAHRNRQLELDDAVFRRTRELIFNALQKNFRLTRQEIFKVLESEGILTKNQRGIHIIQRHALEGLICFGPHRDKQPTFVMLDSWVPAIAELSKEEALYSLAIRYFKSHGPATLKDFIWWSGLKVADARIALDSCKSILICIKQEYEYWFDRDVKSAVNAPKQVYLLPGFDEYVLGYTNRSDVIESKFVKKITPGGGLFYPTVVIEGKIVGNWKTIRSKKEERVEILPFTSIKSSLRKEATNAGNKYLNYLKS
jgi:hypothetical protein